MTTVPGDALVEILDEAGVDDGVTGLVTASVRSVLATLGWPLPPVEVSVTLTGDERLHELNREFRGVDRSTDVLSFPLLDPVEIDDLKDGRVPYGYPEDVPVVLGDIVVNVPEARRAAERYGHSFQREVGFLVAHGLLHLLGFDHDQAEGEQAMRALTEEALRRLGLSRDEG